MAKLEKAKVLVDIVRVVTDVYVIFADRKKEEDKIKKLEKENAELKKRLDEKQANEVSSKHGTILSDTPSTPSKGH